MEWEGESVDVMGYTFGIFLFFYSVIKYYVDFFKAFVIMFVYFLRVVSAMFVKG